MVIYFAGTSSFHTEPACSEDSSFSSHVFKNVKRILDKISEVTKFRYHHKYSDRDNFVHHCKIWRIMAHRKRVELT